MDNFVDISPILEGETGQIDFTLSFDVPQDDAWGDTTFPEPVRVTGSVRDNGGCITLECDASTRYITPCARCLIPVEGTLTLEWDKNVAVPGTLQNEDNDDYVFTDRGRLDICTPLAEQIILEFPSKVLCRPDCKGLCQRCGADLNEGKCSCPEKEIDPRLAILAKIRDELDD